MRRGSGNYVKNNSPNVIKKKLRDYLLRNGFDLSKIFFWERITPKGKVYVEAYMKKTLIASANASKTNGEIECSIMLK